MTPITEICNLCDCKIRITDLTQDSDEYVNSTMFTKDNQITTEGYVYIEDNRFNYSDTVTVNIIQYISTSETTTKVTLGTLHNSKMDEAYYSPDKDGYYQITHLILPTFNENLNGEDFQKLIISGITYYMADVSDCENVQFYKYWYNESTNQIVLSTAEAEELIEVNNNYTTISKKILNTFSVCELYDCYIKLCKSLLNNANLKCSNKNSDLDDLIFKRDFVWMTLNVIEYCIEKGQYLEAQRILEKLSTCGSFCQDINNVKPCGCGCGK